MSALGFSDSGEKDIRFERKNWQPRWGFGSSAHETDGVRDVWVRVSSFLYMYNTYLCILISI